MSTVLAAEHFPKEVLLSSRLKLAYLNEAHHDGLLELARDPDVRKFVPWSDEDPSKVIQGANSDFATKGVLYAIEVKGEFAGFFRVFPSPDANFSDLVEVGVGLLVKFRGKEIIHRLAEFVADLRHKLPNMRLGVCIHDDNQTSGKVALRLGFVSTDQFSFGDRVYEIS